MLRSGRSFSGRERNCAYLNLQGQSFANVSSISGFDSPADGRALALTDWGRDGDLDVWQTNRNSPRVRFLLNDLPSDEHRGGNFLAFLLVASAPDCNRDAIGARLEVVLDDSAGTRLLRTVRAGDGYLSQSSRWLHFGLGKSQRVRSVRVTWPNGQVQTYDPPTVNQRYRLAQTDVSVADQNQLLAVDRVPARSPGPLIHLANRTPAANESLATHNLLTRKLPLPPLPYTSFDGSTGDAATRRQRPLLLNLWSITCATCCAELSKWAGAANASGPTDTGALQLAGADVVTLSIDRINESGSVPTHDIAAMLRQLNVHFPSGTVTDETFHKLQLVHNQLYDHDRPLPVPTTFLIDTEGALAAIYKGPVEPARIERDLQRLQLSEDKLLAAVLPSPGRWAASPADHALPGLMDQLITEGFENDARALAKRLDEMAGGNQVMQARLEVEQAVELSRGGASSQAIERLREALDHDPQSARAHLELGTILGRQNQLDAAIHHLQQSVRLNGDKLPDAHLNLGVALRKVNRLDEAILHLSRALELDSNLKAAHVNLALTYGHRNELAAAAKHFRKATELDPDDVQNRFNLAVALLKLQQPDAALGELFAALQREPDLPIALTMASEVLAKQGRAEEAVKLLRDAVRRSPQQAPLHAMLAGYLEQIGAPDDALRHYRESERLDRGNLRALMRIAWILSTEPNHELRDGKSALRYALRAVEKQPNNVAVLDVMAAVHAELGEFDQAVQVAARAKQLADQNQMVREAKVVEQRLKLYRASKPYRTPSRK